MEEEEELYSDEDYYYYEDYASSCEQGELQSQVGHVASASYTRYLMRTA